MSFRASALVLVAGLAVTSAHAQEPLLAGVIEITGSSAAFSSANTYENNGYMDESGTNGTVQGAARLGVEFAPNLSMQFDGWAYRTGTRSAVSNSWDGDFDDNYNIVSA